MAPSGVMFGGVTSQDFPVVLQGARNLHRITRVTIAIVTECTSGQKFTDHDAYLNLRVSRSGDFSRAFEPEDNGSPAPGITETIEGSMFGHFNKPRTTALGRWRLTFADTDANGNVTDMCDSGAVGWNVRQ
jgi:hypothetical protein